MNSNLKFFVCEKCGNLVNVIEASGVKMRCCGQEMTEVVANTVDASREKHLPVVNVADGVVKVNVGSVDHPMSEEHNIAWVVLHTDKGIYRKHLAAGDAPKVDFIINEENPLAVYAFCNLHGLWKTEL